MNRALDSHTIMVVEDDANIRETLRLALECEGYRVVMAENGAQALNLIAKTRPCLILLDLFMPVMDGMEFLKILRVNADHVIATLPVVIASAAAQELVNTISAKTSGFLKKPFELAGILQTVHEYCPLNSH